MCLGNPDICHCSKCAEFKKSGTYSHRYIGKSLIVSTPEQEESKSLLPDTSKTLLNLIPNKPEFKLIILPQNEPEEETSSSIWDKYKINKL